MDVYLFLTTSFCCSPWAVKTKIFSFPVHHLYHVNGPEPPCDAILKRFNDVCMIAANMRMLMIILLVRCPIASVSLLLWMILLMYKTLQKVVQAMIPTAYQMIPLAINHQMIHPQRVTICNMINLLSCIKSA